MTSLLAMPLAAQERFLPASSAVVLASSVYAKEGRLSRLRQLDQTRRAQPQNLDAVLAYARAVFTLGLNEGDLRWYGSAKAALEPWLNAEQLPAEGYFLRGLIKQGFHDFRGGLGDINRAIALDAHQTEFWSWRFALHLLQADISLASEDTAEIARLFGEAEADIYRAILLYRTGQPFQAVQMLTRAIRSPQNQDVSSQDWLSFHLGEAHRVAGQTEQAIAIWEDRLKLNGQSHLLRLSLAELLNQQGRYAKAQAIALNQTDIPSLTDALLMQALLASRGAKDGREVVLAQQMEARLQAQALRQEKLIERPKLIYQIDYGKDLAAGLALSIENWQLQREPADAVLFVKAALALGQAQAAFPVVDWAERTRYTNPQLRLLIQQLKAHPSWKGGRP